MYIKLCVSLMLIVSHVLQLWLNSLCGVRKLIATYCSSEKYVG
jgi:hypothetical protein